MKRNQFLLAVCLLSFTWSAHAADWRPDVLHAHSPALCGQAALRAGRALGVPVVYEIRAFWEDAAVGNRTGREGSVKYRLTRALEDRVVAEADAVFTICHGLRDDLIARVFEVQLKVGQPPRDGLPFVLPQSAVE